jgi:hypothetical protein
MAVGSKVAPTSHTSHDLREPGHQLAIPVQPAESVHILEINVVK